MEPCRVAKDPASFGRRAYQNLSGESFSKAALGDGSGGLSLDAELLPELGVAIARRKHEQILRELAETPFFLR
jgi:hypothetical protein